MAGTLTPFSLATSVDLDSQDHWSLSISFRGDSATLRCSEMALATPRCCPDLETIRHSISTLAQANFLHRKGAIKAVHFLQPSQLAAHRIAPQPQVLHLGRRPVPSRLLLDPRPY